MTTASLWTNGPVELYRDDGKVRLRVGHEDSPGLSERERWSLAQALLATLPAPGNAA